jgi:response regulator RpfG family c-di-GMP phosphodiesterase
MNGFEFLKAFHQFHKELAPRVEIHMLSSSVDPEDEAYAMQYSMVKSFIIKPLTVAKTKEFYAQLLSQLHGVAQP